jgi:hypothetical protein
MVRMMAEVRGCLEDLKGSLKQRFLAEARSGTEFSMSTPRTIVLKRCVVWRANKLRPVVLQQICASLPT